MSALNKDDDLIPIKWQRIQTVPGDGSRYDTLDEFSNAMINEYKSKIENHIQPSYHALMTYHESNYIQMVDLFPEENQLDLLDDFVIIWCRKYKPKYLVRLHYAYIPKILAGGIVFSVEDTKAWHGKREFQIIKDESGKISKLVEVTNK